MIFIHRFCSFSFFFASPRLCVKLILSKMRDFFLFFLGVLGVLGVCVVHIFLFSRLKYPDTFAQHFIDKIIIRLGPFG